MAPTVFRSDSMLLDWVMGEGGWWGGDEGERKVFIFEMSTIAVFIPAPVERLIV